MDKRNTISSKARRAHLRNEHGLISISSWVTA